MTHPVIEALAAKARGQHAGTLAVLAYGSALREASPEDTLVDLYVLTEDFAGVSDNVFARMGCRLVPPNVRYLETEIGGKTYRAKYAVLPLEQFAKGCSPSTSNPYFWARFCQPATTVWSTDDQAVQTAIAAAKATAFAHAKALKPCASAAQQWAGLFAETYRTEFRPEAVGRNVEIVAANTSHYELAAKQNANVTPIAANWPLRQLAGKTLTILRLIKASFTFQGGPDYLAWKIKRHSGVEIKLTAFQRRHPLIAGVMLLPKLLRKGAVR